MSIHQFAKELPSAAREAANYLFLHPDETIVIFLDPDKPGLHIIDALSITTEADLPLISPSSILFSGTKAVLDTFTIAALAAAQ